LAMSPTGKFLFAGNDTFPTTQPGSVSVFSIDSATGTITAVPGSPFAAGIGLTIVAADPSGKFLYVTDSSPELLVFSVNGNTGALSRVASQSTAPKPTDIAVTN